MVKLKEYLSKSKLRSASILLILMLFSWYCFFGWKYGFAYILGESMEPTYKDREVVVVQNINTLGKEWIPERWDVVIIKNKEEKEDLAKRVIGLAGDTIEIKDGLIYLNGKKIKDPYGKGEIGFHVVDLNEEPLTYWSGPQTGQPVIELENHKPEKIPKGHVWLIGDNRLVSWYGLLPIKDIKSLVIF